MCPLIAFRLTSRISEWNSPFLIVRRPASDLDVKVDVHRPRPADVDGGPRTEAVRVTPERPNALDDRVERLSRIRDRLGERVAPGPVASPGQTVGGTHT